MRDLVDRTGGDARALPDVRSTFSTQSRVKNRRQSDLSDPEADTAEAVRGRKAPVVPRRVGMTDVVATELDDPGAPVNVAMTDACRRHPPKPSVVWAGRGDFD